MDLTFKEALIELNGVYNCKNKDCVNFCTDEDEFCVDCAREEYEKLIALNHY